MDYREYSERDGAADRGWLNRSGGSLISFAPIIILLLGIALFLHGCQVDSLLSGGDDGTTNTGSNGNTQSGPTLSFSVQPSNVVAGRNISPAIEVTALDDRGRPDRSFERMITLELESHSSGGVLVGDASREAKDGVARFGSISVNKAGAGYRITARSGAMTRSSATFTVAPDNQPARMTLASGDQQGGLMGLPLAEPYGVQVTNTLGDPAVGVAVQWAVTRGGGSIPAQSVTGANGIALATHRLGLLPGVHTATASIEGVTGSPVTFTAVAGLGVETLTITSVSGSGQTAVVGSGLTAAYVVRVTDDAGNPVAGVPVSWSASGPSPGTVASQSAETNAAGEVSAIHTLGTVAGQQMVLATSPRADGQTVTFAATALHGPATQLVFGVEPSTTGVGQVIAPPVTVAAQDVYGNIAGTIVADVAIDITPGTGTPLAVLSGTRSVTLAGGVATFGDLRVSLPGTGYRLRATTSALVVDSAPFTVSPLAAR